MRGCDLNNELFYMHVPEWLEGSNLTMVELSRSKLPTVIGLEGSTPREASLESA